MLFDEDFKLLQESVDKRIDLDKNGFTPFEEAVIFYSREPKCPNYNSSCYHPDGTTNAKHTRYRCESYGSSYTFLSDSIFNSAKFSLYKLMEYIELMSFNVPLELLCDILNISSNTAELCRKKIIKTVDGYQEHLLLSVDIWIDETYIEDYEVLAKKTANT